MKFVALLPFLLGSAGLEALIPKGGILTPEHSDSGSFLKLPSSHLGASCPWAQVTMPWLRRFNLMNRNSYPHTVGKNRKMHVRLRCRRVPSDATVSYGKSNFLFKNHNRPVWAGFESHHLVSSLDKERQPGERLAPFPASRSLNTNYSELIIKFISLGFHEIHAIHFWPTKWEETWAEKDFFFISKRDKGKECCVCTHMYKYTSGQWCIQWYDRNTCSHLAAMRGISNTLRIAH